MTLSLLEWVLLIPVIGGSVFAVLCLLASLRFCAKPERLPRAAFAQWLPVTILKPLKGLDEDLDPGQPTQRVTALGDELHRLPGKLIGDQPFMWEVGML